MKLIQYAQAECTTQQFKTSFFILSAICLFHACLECYINDEITIVAFRPEMPAGFCFDQPRGHTDPVDALAHAAIQPVTSPRSRCCRSPICPAM